MCEGKNVKEHGHCNSFGFIVGSGKERETTRFRVQGIGYGVGN